MKLMVSIPRKTYALLKDAWRKTPWLVSILRVGVDKPVKEEEIRQRSVMNRYEGSYQRI